MTANKGWTPPPEPDPTNCPHYVIDGKHFWLLDESALGQAMADQATHFMATRRADGELGYFAAAPEFLAKVIADGERLDA